MSCYHPIPALILRKVNPESGKMDIKLLPRRGNIRQYKEQYGANNIILLPCGSCIGCRKSKVNEWATRLALEGKYHDHKCFLTLTYDDAHLPDKLVKRDVQLFLKRLRKEISPIKVRYFACGEYGEHTKRPHYHLILFGFDFPDRKLYSMGSKGDNLYISSLLSSLWSLGHAVIGEVTPDSCAYVAGYALKKLRGSDFKDEFIMMSTKPGIGAQYIKEHPEVYDSDHIYDNALNGRVSSVPRYFDKITDVDLTDVKDLRVQKTNLILVHRLASCGEIHVEKLFDREESAKCYIPRFSVKGV